MSPELKDLLKLLHLLYDLENWSPYFATLSSPLARILLSSNQAPRFKELVRQLCEGTLMANIKRRSLESSEALWVESRINKSINGFLMDPISIASNSIPPSYLGVLLTCPFLFDFSTRINYLRLHVFDPNRAFAYFSQVLLRSKVLTVRSTPKRRPKTRRCLELIESQSESTNSLAQMSCNVPSKSSRSLRTSVT